MIVVADTSPINYLLQIDLDSLLRQLYLRIALPHTVLLELQAPPAPAVVRQWAHLLPLWVDVLQAQGPFRPELLALDPGERDALQLALSLNANRVLLDERAGSAVAERLGIHVTGTLGILRDAHLLGHLDSRRAYAALREQTNFRVSRSVEARFLSSLTR